MAIERNPPPGRGRGRNHVQPSAAVPAPPGGSCDGCELYAVCRRERGTPACAEGKPGNGWLVRSGPQAKGVNAKRWRRGERHGRARSSLDWVLITDAFAHSMAAIVSSSDTSSLDAVAGDLSDETRLPRELVKRFGEMWYARQQPFFHKVSEDGVMACDDLDEVVRTLRVSSPLLRRSIVRVISDSAPTVTFEQFVRGYAKIHSRTLKDALPFAFAVFDLDGDGTLEQDEFRTVLDANLSMQELDAAAINRVLKAPGNKDAEGVSYNAFRYFASLSSETILATCGFCFHVRDFYVPLTPLGTAEEEEAEEATQRERIRVARERAYAPRAKGSGEGGDKGGTEGGTENGEEDVENPFTHPDFVAAIESLRTTPEERAARCKDNGNESLKHGKSGIERAVQ